MPKSKLKTMFDGVGKKKLKLKWYKDTGFAMSDAGVDSATIYNTGFEGYYLEVFPMKLINKNLRGWEYRIINNEKDIEYESSYSGDHAETPEEAMEWAESTLEDFLKEEKEKY